MEAEDIETARDIGESKRKSGNPRTEGRIRVIEGASEETVRLMKETNCKEAAALAEHDSVVTEKEEEIAELRRRLEDTGSAVGRSQFRELPSTHPLVTMHQP